MLKDILKELRIDRNLTQKQLSEMLDLSKNTVCEAELRTRKNVGTIGDFAIFNEEIMKKNKAFLSLYLVIF